MIETDLRLGDVDLKVNLPGRGTCHLILRGARVCFGQPPRRGLVQLVRAIDDDVLVPFVPDAPTDVVCGDVPPARASTRRRSRPFPFPPPSST